MTKKMKLILPYPPSVNSYWGFKGSHRFLTIKAREFKANCLVAYKQLQQLGFGAARLEVHIELYPPDRRKRDIDNGIKSLLDSLCQAGIFDDDSQIDSLHIVRKELFKKGKCIVTIQNIHFDS